MVTAPPTAAAAPIPLPKPNANAGPKPPADTPVAGPAVTSDPEAMPTGPAAAGAKQPLPMPGGDAAPTDAAAAAKTAMDSILAKLDDTSPQSAIVQADDRLAELGTIMVGGGSPESSVHAQQAATLLTDASMLLQHAHVKGADAFGPKASELQLRIMGSASSLSYMAGQVSVASQSPFALNIGQLAAGSIDATRATMADMLSVLEPKVEDIPAPSGPTGDGAAPIEAPTAPPADRGPDLA